MVDYFRHIMVSKQAGQGVIISWFITALLTLLIALCFAEVASMLPIISGAMRFLSITHSRTLGFLFVALGWISYLVYLPLEAQSVVQYLGFWFPNLVVSDSTGVFYRIMEFLSHL